MAILDGQSGEVTWSGEGTGTSRSSFLAKVEALLAGEPADEASEAVFAALSRRLPASIVQQLIDELPRDLRGELSSCVHRKGDQAQPFDKEDFYLEVAEHLNMDPTDVRRVISAVFAGLHSQITEVVSERVASQLPSNLRGTWVASRKNAHAPH